MRRKIVIALLVSVLSTFSLIGLTASPAAASCIHTDIPGFECVWVCPPGFVCPA